jgi:type I restriction enzyme S subunit
MTTIGEITKPVSTWNPRSSDCRATFVYIDLSAVDNRRKEVTGAVCMSTSEAPSRARQLVNAGDVLVSTVRPNLNAVAVVPPELDGATASTGFTVLRPVTGVSGRYLFHWVRSKWFINEMVRKATGASYPAVSDRIVKESTIPLPTLDQQGRIATILDRGDGLCTKRREVRVLLDELRASVFVDMFGDPDAAIRSRKTVSLSDVVADLQGGKNLVAPDPDAVTRNRVLKISSVTTGRFDPSESKPLPDDYDPPSDYFVRPGDLLFSRANTTELVGATAYVDATPGNLVLPDKLWRFVWRRPENVEPLYVWALFQTPAMRRELSSRSSGTGGSMKNISKAKMATLPLPWPDHADQVAFANRLRAILRLGQLADGCTEDQLFASLQERAFAGRL